MHDISLLCLLFLGACSNSGEFGYKSSSTEIVTRPVDRNTVSSHSGESIVVKNRTKLVRPNKLLK